MIAKILYGARTFGLLSYLYGPGTHEEHHDPRMIASWDETEPDPARTTAVDTAERQTALALLAKHLDRPVAVFEGKGHIRQHVWHTSVRCAPGDVWLNDEQWAQVARRLVAAAGVAPHGDAYGCRWIAVRHSEDHIHIVATLVRQDGQRPDLRGERLRLREECRAIEREYGLRATAPADHSAVPRPTRGEQGKAQRLFKDYRGRVGQPKTTREWLAIAVRQEAVESTSEQDFFARLRQLGMLVQTRTLPSGEVVGYAVARPEDRAKDGAPVWFSGSKLAPDLSLPRVRQRWADLSAPSAATRTQSVGLAKHVADATDGESRRVAAWRQAAEAVRLASSELRQAGDKRGAAATAALADLLTAAAGRAPKQVRDELVTAARAFERAGRVPWHVQTQVAQQARVALRTIAAAGQTLSTGDEDLAALAFILAALQAVRLVAAGYEVRRRETHANAARVAAEHLQEAAEKLGAPARARAGRAAYRADLSQAVRRAVAGRANVDEIFADPAWPTLARMLAQVEASGADPEAVLTQLVHKRALKNDPVSPSRSDAHVLTRRLQMWLAHQTTPADRPNGPAARQPTRTGTPVTQDAPATPDSGVAQSEREQRQPAAKPAIQPGDDNVFCLAALTVVESQECSLPTLAKRLWVRHDKAAELIGQLTRRGFVAPDGDAYVVVVPVEELPALKAAVSSRRVDAARRTSATTSATPTMTPDVKQSTRRLPAETPKQGNRRRQRL
ncbi:hypothetical protein [Microbispora sp. NBRC 16548]|uniref:relaxase/mobilization nuclease domain-containing protein n=1 Tax=Microbispora sp. NBRC 16548 TaxID=3030994 RepID=UPI0024A1D2E0|nr:hypothetical protein [Microbispora sp. NBRC 16548]GLX06769.1 mobilization protein [Microbispora sp. NBRC 16548]